MNNITPPAQPEDAALLKAIDDVVFRCFAQGQYWGSELGSDYLPDQPIDRTEANKTLLQLFREHERQAVQKELRHLGNLIFQLQQEKGDNSIFDRILIAINDGLLQATQPPAVDTTKQDNGGNS